MPQRTIELLPLQQENLSLQCHQNDGELYYYCFHCFFFYRSLHLVLNRTNEASSSDGVAASATNSPPAPQVPRDTCFDDTNTSDAAYKRMMRANDYSHIVHEKLGWSGGAWMATGPNCTVFTIMMGNHDSQPFRAHFTEEPIGSDLCSYGFTYISFDGDVESLNCEARIKRHTHLNHQTVIKSPVHGVYSQPDKGRGDNSADEEPDSR
jgi:hypothetical protein